MPSFDEMEKEMRLLRRRLESAREQAVKYPSAYGKIIWDLENTIEELEVRMNEAALLAPVGSE